MPANQKAAQATAAKQAQPKSSANGSGPKTTAKGSGTPNNSSKPKTNKAPSKQASPDMMKEFQRFVKADKRFAQGRYKNAVKMEYIIGLILIMLYPILKTNFSWAEQFKKMTAWTLLYLGMLSVASISRTTAKVSAAIGGLTILSLLVYEHSAQEGLLVGSVLTKIAEALSPNKNDTSATTTAASTPASSWLWNNWPWKEAGNSSPPPIQTT